MKKEIEGILRKTRRDLETEVVQRTAELEKLNRKLSQEISERKKIEGNMYARSVVLKLFTKTSSRKEYLSAMVKLIRGWSRCQCVGIRLLNEENKILYESFKGFSKKFWKSENCLSLEKDQCTCIRVFTGKTLPMDVREMTEFGSFRCGDTFKFTDGLSKEEKAKLRGRCIREGYRSVSVIPIRYKDETIGVIHLADKRRDMAGTEMIRFIESLTPLIGEMIYKFNLTDAVNKSRELLERIFQSTNFLIAYMDSDFNFIRVNQAYAALYGHNADFLKGKNHFELYPNDENKAIFRKVIETGAPYTAFAKPVMHERYPERGITYWDWNLQPLKDDLGKPDGLILFLIDATNRKRTEERLIKAERELLKAKHLSDIGTLAATVAHELRNPLAGISMAAYNIKRKAANPSLDKHLSTIENKVSESDRIIDNLLLYSRLRPPQYERVNLHEIAEECISIARNRHQKNRISVERKLKPIKRISVEADPLQIKEVFSNVLDNAYGAISGDGGKIEVGASTDEHFVRVYVKDNGSGIAENDLQKIFEPFFTTKAKGTGLGLTVCKQIIDLHGGMIDIKSERSKETTVTIALPVNPVT